MNKPEAPVDKKIKKSVNLDTYIDRAVDVCKKQGQCSAYVASLFGLSDEEKSEVLETATMIALRKNPKRNPYGG